jgi:hypothetical protein
MYRLTYITGNNVDIASVLRKAIEDINSAQGKIVQMVQSSASNAGGFVMVSVTIIYTVG